MDINTTLVNATLPMLESYIEAVNNIVKVVGIFVGGIFGYYIISFIWRIYTYKKNRQLFKALRFDMKHLAKSMDRLEKKINRMEKGKSK